MIVTSRFVVPQGRVLTTNGSIWRHPYGICFTADICSIHSFLEGPKAALSASKDFDNGHYKTVPQHGIRAFGRAYSAWAYGQTVRIGFTLTK